MMSARGWRRTVRQEDRAALVCEDQATMQDRSAARMEALAPHFRDAPGLGERFAADATGLRESARQWRERAAEHRRTSAEAQRQARNQTEKAPVTA